MATVLSVSDAARIARTGDIFLFRGLTPADRAIRAVTNAPVNHVGMAVVIEDLPPLMWHAELGHGLVCVWCGRAHRGVQLHDLEAACRQWMLRYGQAGWLRQLTPEVLRSHEDAALKAIARMDRLPFPSTAGLVRRWVGGRVRARSFRHDVYCAEVVAQTFVDMGLLVGSRPANWYDPGRFWSGDDLELAGGYALGREIALTVG